MFSESGGDYFEIKVQLLTHFRGFIARYEYKGQSSAYEMSSICGLASPSEMFLKYMLKSKSERTPP